MNTTHELLPREVLKRLCENGWKRDTFIELASHVGDITVRGSVELLRNFSALLSDYRDHAGSMPAPLETPHLILCVIVEIVHAATRTKERRNVDYREQIKSRLFEQVSAAGGDGYTQSQFITWVIGRRQELSLLKVPTDLDEVRLRKTLKSRVYELVRQCLQDDSLKQLESSGRADKRERPLTLTEYGRQLYFSWTGREPHSLSAVQVPERGATSATAASVAKMGSKSNSSQVPAMVTALSAPATTDHRQNEEAHDDTKDRVPESELTAGYKDLVEGLGRIKSILGSSTPFVTVPAETAEVLEVVQSMGQSDESLQNAVRLVIRNKKNRKSGKASVCFNALGYAGKTSVAELDAKTRALLHWQNARR